MADVVDFPNEQWKRPGFVISDENLARCVVAKRGDDFCYSHSRGVWRCFDGVRWIDDALLELIEFVRELLNAEIAPDVARKPKDKLRIGSTNVLYSVEKHLRSMLKIEEEAFDADPWLLNCPSGTVNLKADGSTFELRPHERGEHLTKLTAADPATGPLRDECPQWLEFIDWVTCGDQSFAVYLQRWAGYALAGVSIEQALAFLYGSGGNGKSVFLGLLLHVLGDYGVSCPSSVFTLQRHEAHPEELMRLRGARLIVSSEIAPNARWNEMRLKAVTGGERITARYMNENSVEFDVSGTLILAGNNKPELSGVDDAIKRRFHVVPFNAHVEGDDVDKHLTEKLKLEAGGILRWMIEGCAKWQAEGLPLPACVETETSEYLADQDQVQQWRDECCDFHANGTVITKTGVLFTSWKGWAEARGIKAGGINPFSDRLRSTGVPKDRNMKVRGFRGIALKSEQARAEEAASEASEQQTEMTYGREVGGYQIISAEPTSTCEHCGGGGFVYRMRDPFKGVDVHLLHERCAAAFFERC